MYRYTIALLVVVALASFAALFSGGAFLEAALPGGLPVGNALVVIALCSLACAAIAISRPGTLVRYVSVASLVAAAAWLPVSIGLAGNLNLNFSDSWWDVWVALSLSTVALVFVAIAWATIDHLIGRHSQRGPASAGVKESTREPS
jgi:hypothetical protein